MKITLDMSSVFKCAVTGCAYNRNESCHAKAITIGDGDTPRCDTFFTAQFHTRGGQTAGVGACKVLTCKYNTDLECQAPAIQVSAGDSPAMCMTFERR